MALPRIKLRRDWEGLTAVVVGNGCSVLGLDPARLKRPHTRTLVANGGYLYLPFADVLMCTDKRWLGANADLSGYQGNQIIVTREEAVVRVDPRMVAMNRKYIVNHPRGIFADPSTLVEGHTSTSTNISVAVLRGASRIILVGVDLAPGNNGKRRMGDSLIDKPAMYIPRYQRQVEHLTLQAAEVRRAGVEVFNCSPRSGLKCYPYIPLADALDS